LPKEPDDLIFLDRPTFQLGSNTFADVPVIVEYRGTPIIEVSQVENAGFTSQFRIYNPSGDYLAKVKGTQLYEVSEAGKKSNLRLRHPHRMTVCELDGRTLFEVRRTSAAALKASAELHTPDGLFIRVGEDNFFANPLEWGNNPHLPVGEAFILVKDMTITGGDVGIAYNGIDTMTIGVNSQIAQDWQGPDLVPDFQGRRVMAIRVHPLPDGTYDCSDVTVQYHPRVNPSA
jgi:hypothetical protein